MELALSEESIRKKIHTIRGQQVMLDSDLAELYNVNTKRLNEQVKRNIERFPEHFMFRLTDSEYNRLRSQIVTLEKKGNLRSQNVTSKSSSLRPQNATLEPISLRFQNDTLMKGRGKHRKYLPYVFTEQGVAMLSGILRSDIAIKVGIQIMTAFVEMRRFIQSNAQIFQRLDHIDKKHLIYDENFRKIFNSLEIKKPKQGIFFEGQIFDAYKFISDLIRSADKSIILIDNFIDDTVLTLFRKRKSKVNIVIYTNNISKQLKLDLKKYNSQYQPIQIKEFKSSHDRFMIIDNKDIYHIGASLKDLGKKWFAFSKFEIEALEIMRKLDSE